jgi:predicted MFS family arabinose efflux permease
MTSQDDRPMRLSPAYQGLVVSLLAVYSICSWADRTVLSTIGQAIKAELKLSDLQLGLLTGFAFSLLYVTASLPAARLAERYNRVVLISGSIAIWSVFTSLSAVAATFVLLLLCRIGVGVGEACGQPPAYSLIADYFGPRRRASALSIFHLGLPLGIMVGAVAGGFITQSFGWRYAFLFLGLPGILLAVVLLAVVREVPRGHSDTMAGIAPRFEKTPSIAQTARVLFAIPSARHMIAGVTLFTFVNYGAGAFTAPFLIRAFSLNYKEVGLIIGLAVGFANAIGAFAGGFLADAFSARSNRSYALVPMIGLLIACPLFIAAYLQPEWQASVALLAIGGVVQFIYFSPTYGAIYNLVDPRMRATTTALISLVASSIALVIGTAAVGALIDLLSSRFFHQPGGFKALCPGGSALPGSTAELAAACHAAIGQATRYGLSASSFCLAWGGLHFYLASRTISQDMREARAHRMPEIGGASDRQQAAAGGDAMQVADRAGDPADAIAKLHQP